MKFVQWINNTTRITEGKNFVDSVSDLPEDEIKNAIENKLNYPIITICLARFRENRLPTLYTLAEMPVTKE